MKGTVERIPESAVFDLCREAGGDVGHGGGTGRQVEMSQITIFRQQPLGLQ